MFNKAKLPAILILVLVACSPTKENPIVTLIPGLVTANPGATQTATPFAPQNNNSPSTASGTSQSLPTPLPTSSLYLPLSAPPSLREAIHDWGMSITEKPALADARIIMGKESAGAGIPFTSIYAVVAPFPTIADSVPFMDIQNTWMGNLSGVFSGHPLLMDQSTLEALKSLLGEPSPGAVRIIPSDELLDAAWGERPSWAIVPFESLNPKWKVLELDGQSPLLKDFDPESYPLKVQFSCEGSCGDLPRSNRIPDKLSTLIMTGTTALVRATAFKMEENGLTYPAQDIGDILRAADILHITNEISFADNCPYPDSNSQLLMFCSDPRYIALLEDIGTDVVELTGNHMNDWGSRWLGSTVEMYNARGWGHFGGGSNLSDAMTPYKVETNGNKIAFIGCNIAGPPGVWATETTPGAAPCGDYAWMKNSIAVLQSEGYLPITTVQFNEYYQLPPSESQARDFGRLARAGASAVMGSQSHFPQGFAFEGDTYIHYGPGNLFFDQMDIPVVGTRRAAIDRYTIYDGKILGVELITTMLEDWSRPRLMTPEERQQFLMELFTASGW
jgi:hypothetical protein